MHTLTFRRTVVSILLAALLAACGGEDSATLLKSAKDYLGKNDTKAAIIQIKNVLQKEPNLPEARFLLGKALLEGGDVASAEVELRKALDLRYSPDQTVPLLAQAMLAKGQTKKLLEEFGKTELGTPESKAALYTLLAGAHAASGDMEATKATLQQALEARPDHVPAILFQARMKVGERDYDGAQAIIEGLLAKAPTNPEALKFMGDLERFRGKQDEALARYRKAIEVRPDFRPAHVAAISSLAEQGKLDEAEKQLAAMRKVAPADSQALFLSAQLAFQKKDFKQAREALQQYHKVARATPASLQLAGAVEYQLGAYGVAEDNLTKALQEVPNLILARRLLIATHLRTGQAQKALEALKPVMDKMDNSPAMLAVAGEVFIQLGDYKKAEEFYGKATKLDPKDPAKRTRLAMAHMAKGNTEGAFGELEDIAASDSGTTADMALISAHMRRNEIDKALKAIDDLEKKRPDDPSVQNIRGQTLLVKKDVPGARKSFEKALSMKANFFPAASNLAALDMVEKKPDDAKKRFEKVLAADPKNVMAYLALADLASASGAKLDEIVGLINKAVAVDPQDSSARMALVGAYLRAKEPKQAVVAAQEALAAIPDRAELVDAAASAYFAAGDNNQALITLNKLSNLQPRSPTPYFKMAQINMAVKDSNAAIQNLQKSLELKPDYLDGQRALILLYLDAGKHREATAIARDIQKQLPKQSVGYGFEGDIALAQKAPADAVKAYRLGLERAPSTELAVKLYAHFVTSGNGAEAEKLAAAWLKEHPKDLAFRNALAESAGARQDWPAAAQQYRLMLEAQPNNALVLNNLAWVAWKLKDPKALQYAEKANSVAPNQPSVMDTLATLLIDKGDLARGKELLVKAVELAPNQPSIRLNLARALIKAGDRTGARTHLDILAKLGDKFPAQEEVGKLLKEI